VKFEGNNRMVFPERFGETVFVMSTYTIVDSPDGPSL